MGAELARPQGIHLLDSVGRTVDAIASVVHKIPHQRPRVPDIASNVARVVFVNSHPERRQPNPEENAHTNTTFDGHNPSAQPQRFSHEITPDGALDAEVAWSMGAKLPREIGVVRGAAVVFDRQVQKTMRQAEQQKPHQPQQKPDEDRKAKKESVGYRGVAIEVMPAELQSKLRKAARLASEGNFGIYVSILDYPPEIDRARQIYRVGMYKDVFRLVDGNFTGSYHLADPKTIVSIAVMNGNTNPQLTELFEAMGFDSAKAEYFGHTDSPNPHAGDDSMSYIPPTTYYGMNYQSALTSPAA